MPPTPTPTPTTTTTTTTTNDVTALHDLYGRLAHAFDSGIGERFTDLCTEDIEFCGDDVTIATGRSEMADLVRSVAANQPGLRHVISSVCVDVDGHQARGHAYSMALRPTSDGLVFGALAEYNDSLVRQDEGWLLRRRDFVRLAPEAANRSVLLAPREA